MEVSAPGVSRQHCMKVADQGVCDSDVLGEAPVNTEASLRRDECDASSEYTISNRYYKHH